MNQDKMLGGYFEKGLGNLKAVAEAAKQGAPYSASCVQGCSYHSSLIVMT
jgi:hypothetical protein